MHLTSQFYLLILSAVSSAARLPEYQRKLTVKRMADDPARLLVNPMIKDQVYFVKYSSETNGEYTRLRIKLDPTGGTPLHYHKTYTETFSPSTSSSNANDLGVVLSNNHHRLAPGSSITVPKGAVHRFYNPYPDQPISFEVELRPGSEGFEKALSILYGLARDGLCNNEGIPKNPVQAFLIGKLGDLNSAGWGVWLTKPLIWGLQAWGKWSGEEDRLIKKYWKGPTD